MRKLMLGDCLQRMPELKTGSVNLVLADLPYGTTQCRWDSVINLQALWKEYLRVAVDSAAFVFTASQPFTTTLVSSNIKLFKHEWIWIKNRGSNFANTVREPFKEHESVLVFSRGGWTYNKQMQHRTGLGKTLIGKKTSTSAKPRDGIGNFNKLMQKEDVVPKLRVPASYQRFDCEVGLHPTQKPVALMQYLIKTYSNEGDVVLDNTMGSGTTGVAAVTLGRKFIGIEQDPEFFKQAKKRILNVNGGLFAE